MWKMLEIVEHGPTVISVIESTRKPPWKETTLDIVRPARVLTRSPVRDDKNVGKKKKHPVYTARIITCTTTTMPKRPRRHYSDTARIEVPVGRKRKSPPGPHANHNERLIKRQFSSCWTRSSRPYPKHTQLRDACGGPDRPKIRICARKCVRKKTSIFKFRGLSESPIV